MVYVEIILDWSKGVKLLSFSDETLSLSDDERNYMVENQLKNTFSAIERNSGQNRCIVIGSSQQGTQGAGTLGAWQRAAFYKLVAKKSKDVYDEKNREMQLPLYMDTSTTYSELLIETQGVYQRFKELQNMYIETVKFDTAFLKENLLGRRFPRNKANLELEAAEAEVKSAKGNSKLVKEAREKVKVVKTKYKNSLDDHNGYINKQYELIINELKDMKIKMEKRTHHS